MGVGLLCSAAVFALHSEIRDYAWGPTNGLADLLGTEPTGGPEAELWIGAHPSAPSRIAGQERAERLDHLIEAEPDRWLGADVVGRFGPRLPFLLKVLAIGGPLSLQVHPRADRAAAEFARQRADPTAPARYADGHAKPEMLVALTETWALAGLRDPDEAMALVAALDQPALGGLIEALGTREGAADRTSGLRWLLALDGAARPAVAAAALAGAASSDPSHDHDPYGWVTRLARIFPDDPTVIAPLLCHLHHLAPGEGIFLGPGVPHAYLVGRAIEMLGASDNVVRAGLTAKPVDGAEVAAILAPTGEARRITGEPTGTGRRRYRPGAPEIDLWQLEPAPGLDLATPTGPAVVVITAGEVTLAREPGAALVLRSGDSAFVRPGSPVVARGEGTLWWGTAPPS